MGAELRVETEALHASKLLVASGGEQGRIIKIGRFRASTLDNTTLRTPCCLHSLELSKRVQQHHRHSTSFRHIILCRWYMHKDAMRTVSPHRRCHGKGSGGVVRARSSVARGSHSRTNHLARLGAEDRHDAHGSCGRRNPYGPYASLASCTHGRSAGMDQHG